MSAITDTWRGGRASLAFLLGAPLAFGRTAAGSERGVAARVPVTGLFSRFLDACGMTVTVEGDPPAPGTGCVICHNETSFADVAAYFMAVWPHVDRLAGADLYGYIPFARSACRKVDIEMVARGNRGATTLLLDRMVAAVQDGERVGWGGEGRLVGTDGVGRFKLGSSLIAIRAQAPLVPVAIHGGHRALPLGTMRARPGEIRVRFCPPVPTAGCAEADARDVADALQAVVARAYGDLAARRPGPPVP
ncbi:lysophospholipid acyltransferase family protein [Roseicyclus persicicus]|uniref:1-acyl-sn-glycerol-3-phosphate acyltransferase n=1 Tax=Roseicyclus persicicus TaxID=2650661 RepID=A0A7X6JZH2_9RHOB|nr:lysophospholipid acyltransferase family protein [Roseibacterium persicicum]NKX45509.1 1-acyl-sn-glycerol-3-phosphate acyltransferase [Roseibacterium persicicum]